MRILPFLCPLPQSISPSPAGLKPLFSRGLGAWTFKGWALELSRSWVMQGLLGYQLRAFSWIPWWGSGSQNSQTGILPLLVAKDILYPKESGRGKRNKELCWEKLGQIRAEKPSSFLPTYLQRGEEAVSGEGGKGEGGRWKEAGEWRKKKPQNTQDSYSSGCIFHFLPLFSFCIPSQVWRRNTKPLGFTQVKSHTANFDSLLPKLPFSCSRMACHLASNIPLFA